MRVLIAAVGRLKQGPERELAASYRKRAEAAGRSLGFRDFEMIEIRESRAQDAERRRLAGGRGQRARRRRVLRHCAGARQRQRQRRANNEARIATARTAGNHAVQG